VTAVDRKAVKRNAATNVYLPTGHRLGRYEVLVKLATGGMAVVYIGRAQGLAGFERLVALKVLHQNLAHEEEFVRMFLDEARLAARIRHPNVVPTIDISDTPDTGFFIVMDYVEGDHLGALLAGAHKTGAPLPLPVGTRLEIVPNHVCMAFAMLRRANVVEHGKVVAHWDGFGPGASE
jgi:serine/threonine-protein kinase